MKTLRKSLVVLVAVFFLAFPANKAFADASALIDLARFIPLGIEGLAALFSGSDSETKKIEKEESELLESAKQDITKRFTQKGKTLKFVDIREAAIINSESFVVIYNVTLNSMSTVMAIIFVKVKEDHDTWQNYSNDWGSVEEYQSDLREHDNSVKRTIHALLLTNNVNPGPLEPDQPNKTASTASSTPTVPVQPQTPPTVAAPMSNPPIRILAGN